MMKIQLSDHFDLSRLIRFTLPSIIMMVFTSIYSVIDGFFISNFVGITPFAAVNLIMPVPTVLGAVGFMLGAGGSALVSKTLGEGDRARADRIFSLIIYVGLGVSACLAALVIVFLRPIALWLCADDAMLPNCLIYGRFLLGALPFFMLQMMFQSFLITAEKPTMGLVVTVSAGVTNLVLDALFVAALRWGIGGAAVATSLSQVLGGMIPLLYFARPNSSPLKLGKTTFDGRALLSTCANGASELVVNISMSVVSMLFNFQLMKYAGENGVAAYGAVMYISFIFVAIFIGYSTGVAPVIGFHYGAKDPKELASLLRKSLLLIGGVSVALTAMAFLLARPFARLYVGSDPELLSLTVTAFRYFAVAELFIGFNMFGSSFFTALNNGAVSGVLSFLRTLAFQIGAVLILPAIFGLDGVWYSLFAAEILSSLVTVSFFLAMRKRYGY